MVHENRDLRQPFRPSASATTPQKEAEDVKKFFESNGFHLELASPHFCALVPKADAEKLRRLPKPPPAAELEKDSETIPPGALRMVSTDLENLISVYASLAKRAFVLHPPAIAARKITMINGRTTAKEMAWACEAMLALAGAEVRPFGPRVAVALPARAAEWELLKGYAPGLSQGPTDVAPPLLDTLSRTPHLAANNPALSPAQQLLDVWVQLRGLKAAEVSPALANRRLLMAQATPLTHGEAQWLLEVVAALNGWQFDLSTPGTAKLVAAPGRLP